MDYKNLWKAARRAFVSCFLLVVIWLGVVLFALWNNPSSLTAQAIEITTRVFLIGSLPWSSPLMIATAEGVTGSQIPEQQTGGLWQYIIAIASGSIVCCGFALNGAVARVIVALIEHALGSRRYKRQSIE